MPQADETGPHTIRLGLIGDNIARSQAPRLHEFAGRLTGLRVRYDRLTPRVLGKDFEAVVADARAAGYRGLNITYPYKERVVPLVTVADPRVAALGAVNTVVFEADGPKGFNTDWSGFMAGYARAFGDRAPGAVCMVGAGGVGKAVAFGLLSLGLTDIRLVERDLPKAAALGEALRAAAPGLSVTVTGDVEAARGGGVRAGELHAGGDGRLRGHAGAARADGAGPQVGVRCGLHAGGYPVPEDAEAAGACGDERLRALFLSGAARLRDLPRAARSRRRCWAARFRTRHEVLDRHRLARRRAPREARRHRRRRLRRRRDLRGRRAGAEGSPAEIGRMVATTASRSSPSSRSATSRACPSRSARAASSGPGASSS